MKILVVEDEVDLQRALKNGLTKQGHHVDVASDGKQALDLFFSHVFDLIILDLNLPFYDGLELLKVFRKDNDTVNILILSARADIKDKIQGFDLGANDFLAKPFFFAELDARIRALSRRKFLVENIVIKSKYVELDTARKCVLVKGELVMLTKKEYGILEYLMRNMERIVSLEEIIEHVWENEHNSFSNSIKVHLNNLRKKMGHDIIHNKRGEGYYVEQANTQE